MNQYTDAAKRRREDAEDKALQSIIDFATAAHAGQFRRNGITPYISHPIQVAAIVRSNGGSRDAIAAAYLHDVLEDTSATQGQIAAAGASYRVYEAVVALTHKKHEPYVDYINRVNENDLARTVKLADIESNLGDDPSDRQTAKYAQALIILNKQAS